MKKLSLEINYLNICFRLIFILGFSGCLTPANNNIKNKSLESEFLSQIKQNNARYFDHQQDPLTTQQSFFVGNKLKYLRFRHGPEIGFVECRLTFDLTNDAIEKYILREVLPNFERNNNEKVYDTIFVFYPKAHTAEVYYDNKLISTTYRQDVFATQLKFIHELKSGTQNKFNTSKNF